MLAERQHPVVHDEVGAPAAAASRPGSAAAARRPIAWQNPTMCRSPWRSATAPPTSLMSSSSGMNGTS